MKRDKLGQYLIGSYTARLDKSGRIKIPEKFRAAMEEQYGKSVFITSLTDQAVQIYPLPVWEKLAGLTDEGLLHLKPEVRSFMRRVNLKGTHNEIDSKGRILINQTLKEKAGLEEEVEVIGMNNHLEVWCRSRIDELIDEHPLTDEDFQSIAELQPKGNRE
jgi:MraZ protein